MAIPLGNPHGSNTSPGLTTTLDFRVLKSTGNIPIVCNPAMTLPIVMPQTRALQNSSEN